MMGGKEVDRALDFAKQKKWWMVGVIVFILILVVGLLFPKWVFKWQIGKMELNKVERVEYIEYEGTAFSSPIKIKKVLSIENNKTILDDLIEEIYLMDRKKNSIQQCNKILFFYHSNGKIFNAYIENDLLGFNYGNQWLRVEQLNHIIEDMHLVEPLKIKSDSIVIKTQGRKILGLINRYDMI